MKDQARACAIELGEWLYWRTAGCSPEVAKMEAIITKHIAIAVREKDSEISELKDHCNLVWQLIKPFLPACPAKSRKLLDKAMEDSKKLRGEGSHRLAELSAKCQELDSRCYKESIKRLEAEARLERARGALGAVDEYIDKVHAGNDLVIDNRNMSKLIQKVLTDTGGEGCGKDIVR